MKRRPRKYALVDDLRSEFEARKHEIRQRLEQFANVRPEEHFYELTYCLLTPQSSARNAMKAVEDLKASDFLRCEADPTAMLFRKDHYIRFHNTKARHLISAKQMYPEISTKLSNGATGEQLREWLVENVYGLGWKEASHFLRNIGYRNLAILDRHILRNLHRHNVLKAVPTSMTPRRYLSVEQKFLAFSVQIGITMDELDLLFWSRETGEIMK